MKENKEINGAGKFFIFLFGLGADIFRAFVVSKFWTWFLVPLGVIGISVAQALALVLFLSLFLPNSKEEPKWDETRNIIPLSFIKSAILLCFGYILTYFV